MSSCISYPKSLGTQLLQSLSDRSRHPPCISHRCEQMEKRRGNDSTSQQSQHQTNLSSFFFKSTNTVYPTCLVGKFNLLCVFAAHLGGIAIHLYLISPARNAFENFFNAPNTHTHTSLIHPSHLNSEFRVSHNGK